MTVLYEFEYVRYQGMHIHMLMHSTDTLLL